MNKKYKPINDKSDSARIPLTGMMRWYAIASKLLEPAIQTAGPGRENTDNCTPEEENTRTYCLEVAAAAHLLPIAIAFITQKRDTVRYTL